MPKRRERKPEADSTGSNWLNPAPELSRSAFKSNFGAGVSTEDGATSFSVAVPEAPGSAPSDSDDCRMVL